MACRRILSLWFPRFAAEIAVRREPELAGALLAVTQDRMGKRVICALSPGAEAAGLRLDMGVTDARAMCPDLITRDADAAQQADVLAALCRWAGQFSPWIAPDGDAALTADLTGCAHLFGGEAALAERLAEDCTAFGFSPQIGIANTKGAAWAVARFRGGPARARRSGDAIDQEARATRSRATKRRISEPSPVPEAVPVRIVPPDEMRAMLAPLPLAALRLDGESVANLARLGLRVIEDLAQLPRAALARRFGLEIVRRLDQVFGAEPEPLSPEGPPRHFAADRHAASP
ncbi:MAG: DNA polymerase Y family protein [Pseudomonadota bacterium]